MLKSYGRLSKHFLLEMIYKAIIWFLILSGNFFTLVKNDKPSGFYIDNGFDQTLIHEIKAEKDKRQVESGMLNLFNLPPPTNITKNNTSTIARIKRSSSSFLMEIYKYNVNSTEESELNAISSNNSLTGFGLGHQDYTAIGGSDVIMTFTANNRRYKNGRNHEHPRRMWFNTSTISLEDQMLTRAEIWLHRNPMTIKHKKYHGPFTLTAFRVTRSGNGERELEYLSSVNISRNFEGWINLNASSPLLHWITNPTQNRGIYLSIRSNNFYATDIKPEDVGFIGCNGTPEKQPFMVAYLKGSGKKWATLKFKRSAKNLVRSKPNIPGNPYREFRRRINVVTCRMHSLYVNFKDLNWQSWIIAPDGYDAHYCSGACEFPLNAHVEATNHAIVQALVHLNTFGVIPKPSCAPLELTSTSVLYFTDNNNVVLKKYKNMVVQKCGCR